MDFWIIIDQRHAGPFSLEQLREQGITPDRLVWHDGLTDWTPARDIPALAELFAPEPEPVATADPCPPAPDEQFHYGGNYGPQQPPQPPYEAPGQPYGQQPPYGQQQPPYNQPYGPQHPQYAPGQQPYNGGVPPCPPTYLVWAIIATVCCCTPLGIVAIIYAANIKNAYYRGDYMKAQRNSSRAQAWIIAAIVLGILAIPFQLIYFGIIDMANW